MYRNKDTLIRKTTRKQQQPPQEQQQHQQQDANKLVFPLHFNNYMRVSCQNAKCYIDTCFFSQAVITMSFLHMYEEDYYEHKCIHRSQQL